MTFLRLMLAALAVVVFVAIGWRATRQPPRPGPAEVALRAQPPAPASPPAPVPPPAVPPETKAQAPAPSPPEAPQLASAPPEPAIPAPQPATPVVASPPAPAAQPAGPTPPTTAQADARLAESWSRAPDLARVFDAIRAAFPAAAERSQASAVEAVRTSGAVPDADDLLADAMRELAANAGVLASRAGPEALAAIFQAKAEVLAALESADPRICADYLYGGTSPEFSDFVAAHRPLVARAASATLAAMVEGRQHAMSWDVPTAGDYELIERALAARGLSSAEIAALLDGKSLDPAPSDARLCDNMRAYLDVLRALPADARNRVYAFAAALLARS